MERLPSAAAPPESSFIPVTGTSDSDVNECSRRNLGVATADVRKDERPCLASAERSSNLSGLSPREGPTSREGGKSNPLQGISAEYVSSCDSKLGLESSYCEYNYTGSCSSTFESGVSLKPCSTVAYHRSSTSVFRPLSDRTTSGVDQLLEMVARSATQLYRRPLGLILEIVVPLLFIATTIALWGIWGDIPHPEASFVSPPNTTVGMLPAPETIGACWNEKAYADHIGSLPPCSTVSYPYTCDGDMTATPFPPESICRNDAVPFVDMTLAYLTSLVGHLSRVPSLDTIITFQMLAQMQLKPLTELGAMAVSNLHPVMSFNAIIASGKVYIVGQLNFTRKLIEHMNAESSLFSFFNDGNVYASVDEVWSAVPAGSMVWAIVELRSSSAQGLDMVLHMNNSALPSLGTTDDLTYPGGVLNDTAEVYIASGFLTLQQTVTEFYLSYYGLYTTSQTQFLASFPHPEYFRTPLLTRSRELLSFVFGVAFLYSVSQQVKRIVLEKELRIREAMLIMGLRQWAIYVSEFVVQLAIFVPTCVLCVVMLKLTYVTKSDPLILFLIFFLFSLTTIPLSGMIAVFFSKSRLASLVTPVIYFILVIPMFAMTNTHGSIVTWLSLLSPTGFTAALNVFLLHESGSGCGAAQMTSSRDSPTLAVVLGMLSADFFIYYALMLYLDAVVPKEWGTPRHPLFFIMDPVRWCFNSKPQRLGGGADGRAEDGVFETSDYSKDCVSFEGIRKEYLRGGRTFVAVNNLYWGMREGEISVLLGHNGAGKTTVLNMMTGMVSADAGDCYIYGSSVRTAKTDVRQQIGYCPQHNILWPELTCRDHLEFYGKIKGLFGTVLEDAVQLILKQVDLLEKIEYASCALSGGQKRKLSVAIAFVGCSRLIFLDEPTAGMDAAARRYTWELLRRMSEAHTIMLTTHFMDEADLLGHKIGIMSQGCLKCSGSSLFLKSRLGVGYTMNISVNPEVEAEDIDRFIVSLVPNAEALDFNGCEIVYRLPMRDLELFPSMLASLEENGEGIGVRGYSLSATTLEEVFLQIALEDMKKHKERSFVEENETVIQEESNSVWCCEIMTDTRDRLMSQFKSMMVKRLWNALRDRRMQCFQVICPVVCILLAMVLTVVKFTETGFIDLSSEMFGETVQMQVSGCEAYFGATHNVTRQGSYITDLNFASGADLSFYATDTALQLAMPRYTSLFCGDPGLQDTVPFELDAAILFYNTSAYHASGLVLQQLYTYILQSFTNNVNRTFQTGIKLMPAPTSLSEARGGVDTILIGAIIMIPFTFLPSNVVAWVVKERECKARHLQNVSGLSFYIYWLTNFLFDIVAYIITVTMVLLIFLMFNRDEYVGKDTAGPAIVSFLIYGLCSTAGGYVLSFLFDEHSTAQSMTMAISFTAGFLFVMMVFILSLVDSTKNASVNLRWVFRLVPSYCVGESIINLAMDRQQAALGLPSNPWAMDVVGWPCVFMTVEFPIFVLATLFIDHPRRRMWGQKGAYVRSAPAEVIDDEDSDVEDERNQVYQQESKKVNDDVVRVVDLRKVYTSGKVAVRNLAFSILPDEVFGFLGTNGAGKTTTISMLCQEFIPTSGSAYVCGYDIVSESEQALQCIGYCPQFDATLDLLTVEEHLRLYAGIRGIRYEERSKVVAGLLRLCEITEYQRTTAAQLSGGNRRKLSVALALIGSPQIIFLDEPSAGMDPVARRGLWKAIQKVSQNCSVVLTTHHLEEVEELADTVAIMTDGALRCIGDKTHLKQKYGSGFEMSIRIARKDMRMAVQHFVGRHFPTAVLHEFKGQRFVFGLPADTKLSQTFWHLQQNKAQLHITDYSVSQASIEQMFLRICEEQDEREARTVEKEVHFVKSHATLHNYKGSVMRGYHSRKGNRRGERCGEKPAEAVVMVSSSAIEEYRRRMLEADVEF